MADLSFYMERICTLTPLFESDFMRPVKEKAVEMKNRSSSVLPVKPDIMQSYHGGDAYGNCCHKSTSRRSFPGTLPIFNSNGEYTSQFKDI